jgi:hypothetical protein
MKLLEMKEAMEPTYKPFSNYDEYVADGRLNGHFTSNCQSTKIVFLVLIYPPVLTSCFTVLACEPAEDRGAV